jgi:hypothetical protein
MVLSSADINPLLASPDRLLATRFYHNDSYSLKVETQKQLKNSIKMP